MDTLFDSFFLKKKKKNENLTKLTERIYGIQLVLGQINN